MRILVVEDDVIIAGLIRKGLEQARFQVDIAGDGATGLQQARTGDYSLIILDVMLPLMDGWKICSNLRESHNLTPILMLTARDAIDDRVKGLEMGADDYLPKPFDFKELLARVRALLRRDKQHRTRVIKVADLELDTTATRVFRGGKEILLTPREYSLLEALALNEGRVLTRDMIQDRVWQDDDSFSNTVNVHIANLRKKIDAPYETKLIQTVHGFGYMLSDSGAEGR